MPKVNLVVELPDENGKLLLLVTKTEIPTCKHQSKADFYEIWIELYL